MTESSRHAPRGAETRARGIPTRLGVLPIHHALIHRWTRALLLGSMFLVSGCAAVQPWERDQLSDPIMMFDENPLDVKAKQHHLDYREGSTGATGARGGGCGCG